MGVTKPGSRNEPDDSRLLPGVVDTGDSTVIRTCDVTEPRDDTRFRPGRELELPIAVVCFGELTVGDVMLKGVVGE